MNKSELIDSLKQKGFSEQIVGAFERVKREDFIPEKFAAYAYEDLALPLDDGSTISQPYTIALMLSLLELKHGQKILEIGSGSGYVLALMSEIVKDGKIYGIELNKKLAIKSKSILEKDSNIQILNRDGSDGLPEFAPFDRILISASFSSMPKHLFEQLAEGGTMVAAVNQSIFQIKKEAGKISQKEFPGFVFVPIRKE